MRTCQVCGAHEGEVLPRNKYNPPSARTLRRCNLCREVFCDWDFGPHYCGEGEETAGAIGEDSLCYASPALREQYQGGE
jgi:hypothetical protein